MLKTIPLFRPRARYPAFMAIAMLFSAQVWAVPDFTRYESVEKRKEAFFSFFLPLVKERNSEILAIRKKLAQWQDDPEAVDGWSSNDIQDVAAEYGIEDFEPGSPDDWKRLLRRVDVIPPSLALAQAAKESAWGTSGFAREGNNFFGQWCFEKGCGLVPEERPPNEDYEVAVFASAEESVEAYMRNLNRHRGYAPLRRIREDLRSKDEPVTGTALAKGLEDYSAQGEEYVSRVRALIRSNDLARHDQLR
ncbi:glucosaminidase domain-containing protein [Marinobacter sp. HL-58]|uniref:glucosaminidase domain-containing protein n=1 Tax=Marinobacter sp. HL-58 TaxID=1479237 RepID=UPI0006DA7B4A|nr:glucosaminidase domain-containing protein [Marinobacter sp. HL-58]KPP97662.1 MAG: Bax protein [Marinobacter sp. HL-58]